MGVERRATVGGVENTPSLTGNRSAEEGEVFTVGPSGRVVRAGAHDAP